MKTIRRKTALKQIVFFIFVIGIFYLLFSLVNWNIDLSEWGGISRGLWGLSAMLVSIPIIFND